MIQRKMMINKIVCALSVVVCATFSTNAMENNPSRPKTYETNPTKNSSSKPLTTADLNINSIDIQRKNYFDGLKRNNQSIKLFRTEQDNKEKKVAEKKDQEKKEKEQCEKKANITSEQKDKEFKKVDKFVLSEEKCSEKNSKYQQYLDNLLTSKEEDNDLFLKELAAMACGFKNKDVPNEANNDILLDNPPAITTIISIRTKKPRTPTSVVQNNVLASAPDNPCGQLIHLIVNRQPKLVLEMLEEDARKGKELIECSPLAKRLYEISKNEHHGLITCHKSVIAKGALDYTTLWIARQFPTPNVEYIGKHLQASAIDSIKKEKTETLSSYRPQCYGWEFGCCAYKKCNHSVNVGQFPYKRFCNIPISGKTILAQKTPLTRSLMKSAKMTYLLNNYLYKTEEYARCIQFPDKRVSAWYWSENILRLTKDWLKNNKKCDVSKCSNNLCIKSDQKYIASLAIPTQEALQEKPNLATVVSLAKVGKRTAYTYPHSPFVPLGQ